MKDRWNLKGKKALVTGGTKGIGLAIVREFSDLGAEVFFIARNIQGSDNIFPETDKPGTLLGFSCDTTRREDRQKLFSALQSKWDRLDILVNNAGMNIRKATMTYSKHEYDKIMETNLYSAWELCRLFHPMLCKSEQGNIINISSVAGQTSVRSGIVYGMSKSSMIHMTRYLAAEWAHEGIRVNAIAPWYINTPLTHSVLNDEAYRNEVIARTPIKKTGEPEDVSAAAAFLCMPASAHITGQTISVDGGFTIHGF